MKTKQIVIILGFILVPFFVSAAPTLESFGFKGTKMVFNADLACQSELTYTSFDKTITYNIKDSVYRRNREVQLWNLDFTSFDYILKLKDNKGNVSVNEGVFNVVPADPTLIIEKEEGDVLNPEKPLDEMTRDELIAFLDKIMRQLDLR